MSTREDLTGKTYGRLTVLEYSHYNKVSRAVYWKCKCQCGKEVTVRKDTLLRGAPNSCECVPSKNKREDLTGKVFGRLTVIEYAGLDESKKRALWKCKCECGEVIITRKDGLKTGAVKSCGCLNKEIQEDFVKNLKTHGLSGTQFFRIWHHIKQRCENPNTKKYEDYGGREIKVCERWQTFENFIEDMYESHLEHVKKFGEKNTSIDRIDVNGNYEPSNCRWATSKVQQNNTRLQKPFIATNLETGEQRYGTSQRLFAEEVGIPPYHISAVLNGRRKSTYGWTFKRVEEEGK